MGNPFKAKPGSKKLNDPVSVCPNTKGEIRIETWATDPRGVEPNEALSGVALSVTGGPTATSDAKTAADGRWRYQPLSAGTYTVTPTFNTDLAEKHDTSAAAARNQLLAAGGRATVVFLVPWNWVEFIVHDTAGRALQNLDWQLAWQAPAGFEEYATGTTGADGKIYRKKVKRGTHRLEIKALTRPSWSGEAKIGTEIVLAAETEGFKVGDAGTIDILDGHDLNTVLQTLPATVKQTNGTLRLEARWKPAEGPIANLRHSLIGFRAVAGRAVVYSSRETLWKEEPVRFEDGKGRSVDRQVELIFLGGRAVTVSTLNGKVNAKVPWGDALRAVKLTGLTKARVKIESGALAGNVSV